MRTYFIYARINGQLEVYTEYDRNVKDAIQHVRNDCVGSHIEILKICSKVGGKLKELKSYVGKKYYTKKVEGF